jgi:hypothetical protein
MPLTFRRIPVRLTVLSAPVAQWIERLTSDQKVGGSNPSGRATIKRQKGRGFPVVLFWVRVKIRRSGQDRANHS